MEYWSSWAEAVQDRGEIRRGFLGTVRLQNRESGGSREAYLEAVSFGSKLRGAELWILKLDPAARERDDLTGASAMVE